MASTVPPAYPLAAKAAGIEGKVVVKGVIGTDGKMRNVRAVKGPIELRQAAIHAVSQWVYHPYTHRGALVEVDTTVTVIFTMGSKKEKAAAQEAAQEASAKAASKNPSQVSPLGQPLKIEKRMLYPFHHAPIKLATAIAAVSVRRIVGPRLTDCQPVSAKLESSAEVHPPSGPIAV